MIRIVWLCMEKESLKLPRSFNLELKNGKVDRSCPLDAARCNLHYCSVRSAPAPFFFVDKIITTIRNEEAGEVSFRPSTSHSLATSLHHVRISSSTQCVTHTIYIWLRGGKAKNVHEKSGSVEPIKKFLSSASTNMKCLWAVKSAWHDSSERCKKEELALHNIIKIKMCMMDANLSAILKKLQAGVRWVFLKMVVAASYYSYYSWSWVSPFFKSIALEVILLDCLICLDQSYHAKVCFKWLLNRLKFTQETPAES
jgi:hypothetical protein